MKLELRVQRQGMDPTAESSLHALRDIMQLPVLAVEHGELLQFDVAEVADGSEARDALEKAASRVARYVNLNRDVMIWDVTESTRPMPAEGCAVDVWVRQGDGSDARALQWFQKYSDVECQSVRRGRWYRVHVCTEDTQEAKRWVEDLAVSRTRQAGLLANPHTDTIDILRVQPNQRGSVDHAV